MTAAVGVGAALYAHLSWWQVLTALIPGAVVFLGTLSWWHSDPAYCNHLHRWMAPVYWLRHRAETVEELTRSTMLTSLAQFRYEMGGEFDYHHVKQLELEKHQARVELALFWLSRDQREVAWTLWSESDDMVLGEAARLARRL